MLLISKRYITILLFNISLMTAFAQGDTMYVNGRHIYSAEGEKIILRGMNIMSVWSSDKTGSWSMAEIAKTGANCARLVWTESNGQKDQLAQLIENCVANKMIAIPECHDATGDFGKLDICINFWNDSTLIETMQRNKKWTILNIGNEVGDHAVSAEQFSQEYKRAIDSIRFWGYTMPILIDASGWGQNVDILFATWKEIKNHDPLKNVIFSAHSYWSGTTNYDKIASKSLSDSIPIIVGEGPSITLVSGCTILKYDYGLTVLGENEIGWLSWSWGIVSNGDCKPYFDHTTDGKFGNWETEYAKNLVVNHKYGLMQTAERPASMFDANIVPVSGIHIVTSKETFHPSDTVYFKTIIAPANADDANTKIQYEILQNAEYITLSNDSSFFIVNDTGIVNIKATHIKSGISQNQDITIATNPIISIISDINENTNIYPIPLNKQALNIRFGEVKTGIVMFYSYSGALIKTLPFNKETQLTLDSKVMGEHDKLILNIIYENGTTDTRIIAK